jgi:hypothetical protein
VAGRHRQDRRIPAIRSPAETEKYVKEQYELYDKLITSLASASRPMRGADLVARGLARAGVRHVFALSGNHVMPVFDAALDAKLPILHVRHEAAAVHMADAWARITAKPASRW